MSKKFVKTALIGAFSVAMLAGCGTKAIKADPRKPAKLEKITAPISVLTPVMSVKLEQGGSVLKKRAKAKDVIDLQVAPIAGGVIAASRGGVVMADGATKWQLNVDDAISSGVAIDAAQSLAVVGTRSGKIVAIDAKTGEMRWQAQLPSASLAPALVHANRVIVSTNGGVMYGLDAQTGKMTWQYSTQAPTVSVRGMARPMLLGNATAVIGASDGRIHALDIASGAPLWIQRVGLAAGNGDIARLRDVDGMPLLVGNQLYITSFSGQLLGIDLARAGRSPDDVRPLFVAKLASTNSATALGEQVIGTNIDGEIVAYHRGNGAPLWTNSELKFRKLTNPATIGSYIAVGDNQGVLHILDKAGKIVSRIETKNPLTSLQVVDNRLYAQSSNGVVNIWQF